MAARTGMALGTRTGVSPGMRTQGQGWLWGQERVSPRMAMETGEAMGTGVTPGVAVGTVTTMGTDMALGMG